MPEEFVCQDCGCAEEVVSEGASCPFCGGKFVNLNDDLVSLEVDNGEFEEEGMNVDGGFSTI